MKLGNSKAPSSGWQPCLQLGDWILMIFGVSSDTNRSVILRQLGEMWVPELFVKVVALTSD